MSLNSCGAAIVIEDGSLSLGSTGTFERAASSRRMRVGGQGCFGTWIALNSLLAVEVI
jgi:hypothetical protein